MDKPDIDFQACANVLAGFDSQGRTRFESAADFAKEELDKGNTAPALAIPGLAKRIQENDISCDCRECGSWDGLHRRCSCGNRRVYWEWVGTDFVPSVY